MRRLPSAATPGRRIVRSAKYPGSLGEGIENLHAGQSKVAGVARRDRQAMQERGRGYHPVKQRRKLYRQTQAPSVKMRQLQDRRPLPI